MSSILKALRRLEEDRARKSHVAPEIAASLLRSGSYRRRSPLWIWPAAIAVGALAVVAFLFWSWRPHPVAQQVLAPALPQVNLSIDSSSGQGGEVIIEEVIDQRRPVLSPSQSTPVPASASLPASVTPAPAPQPLVPVVMTPAATKQAAAVLIEERQSPVVSAIAWQEDSLARMAVVDGLPVMTGESVGTAIIAEIQRDRVLFVEAGTHFAVRIHPQ